MVTDGRHTCGKHSIMYKLVESPCYMAETKVTLCVNYISIKKKTIPFMIVSKRIKYLRIYLTKVKDLYKKKPPKHFCKKLDINKWKLPMFM